MRSTALRSTTAALGFTAMMLTLGGASAYAQGHGDMDGGAAIRAMYSADIETMESKFKELAGAMGADKYTWQPMDSVRTVSEVFMLIASENYMIPSTWGAAPPAGVTVDRTMWDTMAAVTDKAKVQDHLAKSYTYFKNAVGSLTDEQLHSQVNFFGRQRTVNEALFLIITDMHEHLGQAIAYARMNQVVPPWTARAQARQSN
jgi:DinB superfamily